MRRFPKLMMMGLLALACACTDYETQLDGLEKQIEELEQGMESCSGLVTGLGTVVSNLQDGNGVADIKAIISGGEATGYEVLFADGGKVTLYNQPGYITVGEDGGNYFWKVNGDWMLDAEGEKVSIDPKESPAPLFDVQNHKLMYSVDGGASYQVAGDLAQEVISGMSQDDANFYLELAEGGRIVLPKGQPFSVEISGDETEITDGATVTARYAVTGSTPDTEVRVLAGEGWKAEINKTNASEGTITVTAPTPVTTDKVLVAVSDGKGKMVVKALRLTVKNTVQRGNIQTYVYHGVRIRHIDPTLNSDEVALSRYQAVTDAGIQIMSADGGNIWNNEAYYDEVVYQLDLAERAGLKLAICVDCYIGDDSNPEGHPEELRRMVNLIKDHPALWGYQLVDEPNADLFKYIYKTKQVINEIDNEHLCYVNLCCTGGTFGPIGSYHTNTYGEYLDRCLNECHPDFLSFDQYPCLLDRVIQTNWYSSLEQVADKAKAAGLDFWAFAASCRYRDALGWRTPPSIESLRLQDYTNLAYGAQCLEYFTWAACSGEFADWVVDMTGEINPTNPTFEYLQFVNREVQKRAFVFDGCDVKWTALYHEVPAGCRAVDESRIPDVITSVYSKDSFLMSHLENDGGKSGYFCIVSRTHIKPTTIHLRLRYPVQTVERDGSLKVVNPGDRDFTIDPGDILIFKIR